MARVTEAKLQQEAVPEDFLRLALEAQSPQKRERYAQAGLTLADVELTPDTRVLLLRQLYLSQLERRQLGRAARTAMEMAEIGPLADVAHHDAARALAADGDLAAAISAQRLAARKAPATRRSFQLWSLATLQHHAGEPGAALDSLSRATRWASRDGPLLRAHAAYVTLDSGEIPEALDEVTASLKASACRQGYGEYLLGMIAYLASDGRSAAPLLRAFLRRHAATDVPQLLTLQEELRRARRVLAQIESV